VTLLSIPCFTLIIYTQQDRFLPAPIVQKCDPTPACKAGRVLRSMSVLRVAVLHAPTRFFGFDSWRPDKRKPGRNAPAGFMFCIATALAAADASRA
jgi:hypothetical protein